MLKFLRRYGDDMVKRLGRNSLEPGVTRTQLSATVRPNTLAYLDALVDAAQSSRGRLLDELIEAAYAKSSKSSKSKKAHA